MPSGGWKSPITAAPADHGRFRWLLTDRGNRLLNRKTDNSANASRLQIVGWQFKKAIVLQSVCFLRFGMFNVPFTRNGVLSALYGHRYASTTRASGGGLPTVRLQNSLILRLTNAADARSATAGKLDSPPRCCVDTCQAPFIEDLVHTVATRRVHCRIVPG